MSTINPISGSMAPMGPMQVPSQAGKASQASGVGGGFGETLKEALTSASEDQQKTAVAIQDLLTGRSEDMLPVVSAVAKSDMSFKLLMGVRNKVIEAYKQTMNMQI